MGLLEQMCTSAIVFVVCKVSEFPRKRPVTPSNGHHSKNPENKKEYRVITKLQTKIKF